MKKIILCSTKENIEIDCPDWVYEVIRPLIKYITIKTVTLNNGADFSSVFVDEIQNLKDKK